MNTDFKGVCHPWLCDIMGHMTTRHYMAMFDDASYHFLYRAFNWSANEAKLNNIGWADVKHTIEYQAEVSEGQLLSISGRLTKIGTKSITVLYEMIENESNVTVATLESVSVLFDTKNRKALALSSKMIEQASLLL
jgi:acyl-CoA thioester hydrolase